MAGTQAGAQKRRASIQTSDVETAGEKSFNLESNLNALGAGVKNEDLERPDLIVVTDETVDSPFVKEYMNDLKFMEDILTIMIGETTDKNAENPVPTGVNGEVRNLIRGQEYKLPRKFVDSLIKVEDAVSTEQYKDKDGVDQTRVKKVPSLKYPLSILHDPAGDVGRRWFQHQCKNCW